MNILDYHWVWYILGFLFAPRLTLAIMLCIYIPVHICWKIIAISIAMLWGCADGSR